MIDTQDIDRIHDILEVLMRDKDKTIDNVRSTLKDIMAGLPRLTMRLFGSITDEQAEAIAQSYMIDRLIESNPHHRIANKDPFAPNGRNYATTQSICGMSRIVTKQALWLEQAPSFSFELDQDELLALALKYKYVKEVGPDQFEINYEYIPNINVGDGSIKDLI